MTLAPSPTPTGPRSGTAIAQKHEKERDPHRIAAHRPPINRPTKLCVGGHYRLQYCTDVLSTVVLVVLDSGHWIKESHTHMIEA